MKNFIVRNPIIPFICGLPTGLLIGELLKGVSQSLAILYTIIIIVLVTTFIYRMTILIVENNNAKTDFKKKMIKYESRIK